MKKFNLFFSLILLTFFSSCNNDDNNCTSGEGQIVDETRSVADFTEVFVELSGNVLITQGGTTQEVVVRSHANIIPLVETKVTSGGILTITVNGCTGSVNQLDILITTPDIESLILNGSGNIEGQNSFDMDQLDLILNGSGNITAQGTFGDLLMTITGSGNFTGSGSADNFGATVNGSGNISSFDLQSKNCAVLVTGSGNSELSVSDSLQVTITGSGNVQYKGDPVVNENVTGSGTVEKVD